MSTKIRNKSAAHTNNINSHHHISATTIATTTNTGGGFAGENGNSNGHNNQQSLLKIESVVPKLTSRALKLNKLTKSHSTLTSAYIKKVNESKRTFVVTKQERKNGSVVVAAATHQSVGNDSSICVTNGIYTIKRNQKEKEKLPDRINLDRKGLTMIPAIEEEPNLRLLSLQHNLINVFYIPGDADLSINKKVDISSPPKEINVPSNTNNCSNQSATISTRNPILTRQLTRQRSITATRSQLILNNNNISYMGNNSNKLGLGSQGVNNGTVNINNQSNNIATINSTFLQKPLLLNAQQKHILKRSNSFINNYPNILSTASSATPMMTSLQQAQIQKNQPGQFMRHRLIRAPSFSMDNLSSVISTATNGQAINGIDETLTPTPDTMRSLNGVVIDSPPAFEVRHCLLNLVFLDLYDNQIEVIANLDGLRSLTVLLLGKNRISDISGLVCVKNTLRVLDLHGNKISNISQKISPLQELKSLNLAGNLLKQVHEKDFTGLYSLKELNLKRNKIRKIVGFDDLRSLERLWLCHNELQRVEDMSSIARALNLKEVTIENNPVSLAGDCVSFLVSYLPHLISLSQMHITEQVRRAAAAWRKNKETSDANYLNLTSDVCHSMRREEIISNARTNWELLRSQQSTVTSKYIPVPPQKLLNSTQVTVKEVDVFTNNHENGTKKRATRTPLSHNNRLKRGKKLLKPESRNNSTTSEQGGEDYFRLPPILGPFLDQNKDSPNSASSLGPNIDSGSSVYSSENEEKDTTIVKESPVKPNSDTEQAVVVTVTDDLTPVMSGKTDKPPTPAKKPESPQIAQLTQNNEKPTTPKKEDPPKPVEQKHDTLPLPIHEITLPIVDDQQTADKQSIVSTQSGKSNESLTTNVSSSERNEKCKSAPRRQNTISSISTNSRAQTARNVNNTINANNNTGELYPLFIDVSLI